jgi:conjugative relaxase-like TrwC/TraI family protein
MLTISKPLSASQAQTYHAKEFTAAEQNYWKQGDTIQGEWQGQLADKFGLAGGVGAEEFARLSEGQHPQTGEEMIRHRKVQEYQSEDGKTIAPVEHRAGWDATFSAPKSVSLTALVGGDERVREAHRVAVTVALKELESYTQARIGGNTAAEMTGQFLAAKFEHDTARPVDGYAAPQLHSSQCSVRGSWECSSENILSKVTSAVPRATVAPCTVSSDMDVIVTSRTCTSLDSTCPLITWETR